MTTKRQRPPYQNEEMENFNILFPRENRTHPIVFPHHYATEPKRLLGRKLAICVNVKKTSKRTATNIKKKQHEIYILLKNRYIM